MRLRPVAEVVNGIHEDVDDWTGIESRLIFREDLVPGLDGIARFDNVWIIFGFHKKKGYRLKVHPRHDPSRPLVGVFASRSPKRPNRLGLTLVEVLSVRGNVLRVRGLDAFDGTPVYDIKPYEKEIDY